MNGKISAIQRYSVNDGYGIRTIVFLLGCSMRCAWCQNPETLDGRKLSLMFVQDSCSGCGACVPSCPAGAVRVEGGRITLDRDACKNCLECVGACYFGARKTSGRMTTLESVFGEVMKDEVFYKKSGGGLTLSGGEPLLQPRFSRELLRLTKERGVHTAVETAGNAPYASFEKVLPFTDLFLYDVKFFDAGLHRRYTGVHNRLILDNLRRLTETGVEIIARVPLVPGVNDGREFEAIAHHVASMPGIGELHIMPYHTLGQSKYEQLGCAAPMADLDEENGEEVARCRDYAKRLGFKVSVGGAGFDKKRGNDEEREKPSHAAAEPEERREGA